MATCPLARIYPKNGEKQCRQISTARPLEEKLYESGRRFGVMGQRGLALGPDHGAVVDESLSSAISIGNSLLSLARATEYLDLRDSGGRGSRDYISCAHQQLFRGEKGFLNKMSSRIQK